MGRNGFSSGFVSTPVGKVIGGWFRNLPQGITVRSVALVLDGALEIDAGFIGTLTAGSSAAMQILIPAEALNFGGEVPVALNINAK